MVVSDSHLSAAAPEGLTNWEAVAAHVGRTRPALVVHLGDVTLDGARHPDELGPARELLDRLPVVWRALPGNHDVGDNPWPGCDATETVNAERLQGWADAFGPDRFVVELGGWTVIGLNTQLFASGLAEEADQWAWLEGHLERSAGRPTLLCTHKPLRGPADEQAAAPPYRFVPPEAAARLGEILGAARVAARLSGHVHQFRRLELDGQLSVWAPTSWAVLPDRIQPVLGAKQVGVLSVLLDDDATAIVEFTEPPGIAQLTIGEQIADPYGP